LATMVAPETSAPRAASTRDLSTQPPSPAYTGCHTFATTAVGRCRHLQRWCKLVCGKTSCGRRGTTPADAASRPGSVTKRFLGIPIQSTYECKTRGEGKWHCPPRGKADAQTRKPCHATMGSRAPSKPCLIAPFLLRFRRSASPCRACGQYPRGL
jgi:hypothetical protein